jgi:hypothetical protein
MRSKNQVDQAEKQRIFSLKLRKKKRLSEVACTVNLLLQHKTQSKRNQRKAGRRIYQGRL